jgi:hypothetical protein
MAAASPTTSAQYDQELAGGAVKQSAETHGKLQIHKMVYTTGSAGAGDLTAYPIGILPAGELTIYPHLSTFWIADSAATSQCDFGYGAFTNEDGTAVVADPNAWADSIDIASGPTANTWASDATIIRPTTYNSKGGIPVTVSTDTADFPASSSIELSVAYVLHG